MVLRALFRALVHDKTGHLAFLDLKPVLFWEVKEQLGGLFCNWDGKDVFQTKDPHANIVCLPQNSVFKQNLCYLLHIL